MMNRRTFSKTLGFGCLAAGSGLLSALVRGDSVRSFLDDEALDFGPLEGLATMMQENDADPLMAKVVGVLKKGTSLTDVAAAAALANARTFGGQDYNGYHCLMALIPSLDMGRFMPAGKEALPLLKVLHRNTRRIRERGGRSKETMHRIAASKRSADGGAALLAAERQGDMDAAISTFAAEIRHDPARAYELLQPIVRENIDVHQVVLAWRAFDFIRVAGEAHTETLLVQALRQCVDRERSRRAQDRPEPAIRTALPPLLATPRRMKAATRADDDRVDALARAVFEKSSADAMSAVADALAEGLDHTSIGEAISVAAVRLLLHDPGRKNPSPGAAAGTVHGASTGLHASDAANAWRHIAEVCPAEAEATLLAAGYHTGGQSNYVAKDEVRHASGRAAAAEVADDRLVAEIAAAIDAGDQVRSAALAERYGERGLDVAPFFRTLITPAVADDGALHHEKFFATAVEEHARARARFRPLWLAALARVLACGRDTRAPGVEAASELL